jgi:predicted N-formylglutamate amidohydrolase
MPRPQPPQDYLLLTCEHAGNDIPREHALLFRGADDLVNSHRGWDPGTLPLARATARRLGCPLFANTWCRLLVESNRSPTNHRIWSRFTAGLPKSTRDTILQRWWLPHRQSVENAVMAAARTHRVVHVAVHSFTPELDGEVRNADVGLLYDPGRKPEVQLCRRWAAILRQRDPGLRIRMNYPYRGNADGLTTWLRRKHPPSRYLGIELEINQALVNAPSWRPFQELIAASLREAMGTR